MLHDRCPYIWENVHPAIPIVFAYLFVLTLTSMIKTSWTDPGASIQIRAMQQHVANICILQIIPRDLDPFPALDTYEDPGSPYSSMWHQDIPTQREVRIKDTTWTLRYCETCRIYRPPRASHCRQCDNCVGKIRVIFSILALIHLLFRGGRSSLHMA